MIDPEDWVLRMEPPSPNLLANYEPPALLKEYGDNETAPVIAVAKELARVKQEPSTEAWYHYLGMAVTWLAQQPDAAPDAAVRAADPDSTCDTLRLEP